MAFDTSFMEENLDENQTMLLNMRADKLIKKLC